MSSSETPTFAVVGHPNKGKSSIVATLARDDSVAVAPEPGTTVHARRYPLTLDGRELYTLIDTPGFQRARRALAWMREHETDASEHAAVVRNFIREHKGSDQFPDEVRLLEPIMEGAGILYVVDGSKPFGSEYEAEMEILRWTGQPSMALINPIGRADHVEPWRQALGQYFKIVRVFNALTAEFEKRQELLRAFGQLKDEWRRPLEEAVEALQADRERRRRHAADAIAAMMTRALTLSVTKRLGPDDDPTPHKPKLEEQLRERLRRLEDESRARVDDIYDHHALARRERALDLLEQDLFSERAWLAFGVKLRDVIAAGAAGGAAAGAWVDVVAHGGTFFTGMGVGAVLGGAAAFFSAHKLAQVKVVTLPLGGTELRCGPPQNANFAFVLLNRARLHHRLVSSRTHADRRDLDIDEASQCSPMPELDRARRKELMRIAKRLQKAGRKGQSEPGADPELGALVEAVLTGDAQ